MTLRRSPFAERFPTIDDEVSVGGIAASRLAHRVGQTPFYAYDRRLITERVRQLRSVLPPEVQLHYAIKANPMPAVVGHLAGLVDGLDVASGGELRVALDSGIAATEISFAGPGKSEVEVRQAVAAGVLLNAESMRDLELAAAAARQVGATARVALRVNPDFELKSSGMKMGGGPKQFGIDAEIVPEALDALRGLGLHFEGFHIFSGSQNLRAESICEALGKAFALATRLARSAPCPVTTLNLGGGFGIPYFSAEQALQVDPIGDTLRHILEAAKTDLPEAKLVIELGRYLVGEAGVYVARVTDRKVSRGEVFLVTDGGLHHHLAASGNFGQVIRKNYPVEIATGATRSERETASVVGPLCTPLDLLADRMELAAARPGDLVVVYQSGAYGLTASPARFLGHPPPIEVLV